jgi:hypothetical protein
MCTFVNFGLTLRWTWFLGDEAVISVFWRKIPNDEYLFPMESDRTRWGERFRHLYNFHKNPCKMDFLSSISVFWIFWKKILNNECIFTSPFDLARLEDHFRPSKVFFRMRRKRTICTFSSILDSNSALDLVFGRWSGYFRFLKKKS